MAFPFSFPDQPSSGALLPLEMDLSGQTGLNQAYPVPWATYEAEIQTTHVSAAPMTGGLAALAVQQSNTGPLLAPPSRRLSSYMAPGPAIAASLALAAQGSGGLPPKIEDPLPSAPATSHYSTVQSLQSRELAELRMELEKEMEQLRQDLFGAAMGVSALKDRMDNLESAVLHPPAPPPAPGLSPSDVETLIRGWLDDHLPVCVGHAVQSNLDQAFQQTVARLTSTEFFRMSGPAPGLPPEQVFSQPPLILSTSLS